MIGAIECGQLDLFPRATEEDKETAKRKLSRYKRYVSIKIELEKRSKLTPKQQVALEECNRNIIDLEGAVKLILDPEIREIVQYRYIEGNTWKLTVLHFANMMDDRTVDHKLRRGIESVAETLLIC